MRNISGKTLEQELENEIRRLKKEVKALKTNQLSVIVIPSLTADPATPVDGQIWYRSDTDVYKGRQNGVTKTFTTS